MAEALIFSVIAKIFLDKLGKYVIEKTLNLLKGDPVKKAVTKAFINAVKHYAKNQKCIEVVNALVSDKVNLLKSDVIIEQLTNIVRPGYNVNIEVISEEWNKICGTIENIQFKSESKVLVKYIERELKNTNIFINLFLNKSLDNISDVLQDYKQDAVDLHKLVEGGFNSLIRLSNTNNNSNVKNMIRNYTYIIRDKTNKFVGRRFIFDKIDDFMSTNECGYLFIVGQPGIGKSSISAQLVKTRSYVHHFNIKREGTNKTDMFLRNVCSQLIIKYEIECNITNTSFDDAGLLNEILEIISEKGQIITIVVDALDEVNSYDAVNPLCLPVKLPKNVFIIVTTRISPENRQRIDCHYEVYVVKNDSNNNIADVTQYINNFVDRGILKQHIDSNNIDKKLFVETVARKSEYNFMYLYYVLPEIEKGNYEYERLPTGLMNYYEDHWERMKTKVSKDEWQDYLLVIEIIVLSAEKKVTLDQIYEFTKNQKNVDIDSVLNDWNQFLTTVEENEITYYRIYHATFNEFIYKKNFEQTKSQSLGSARKAILKTFEEDLEKFNQKI